MGDLLAGTPEVMMAFTADAPAVSDSGGGLTPAMEESGTFQTANGAAAQRLRAFVAETNTRVNDHVDDATLSGRTYLDSDEISAVRIELVDTRVPR